MPSRRRDANAKQVNVRMPPDELKSLDVWIKTQPAPRPTRAEAIRRLVGQALVGGAQPSQKRRKKSAAKAREMAGQAIDRLLGDAGSLPVDEQERRKRRLTKGPNDFGKFAATSPSRRADRFRGGPAANWNRAGVQRPRRERPSIRKSAPVG
ncbi:MAG: hypothetical protein WA683_26035, partial [Pseudolabrys sp.]